MKAKLFIPLTLNILVILFLPYHVIEAGFNTTIVWRFVLNLGPGMSSVAYGVIAGEISLIWLLFLILNQKSEKQ